MCEATGRHVTITLEQRVSRDRQTGHGASPLAPGSAALQDPLPEASRTPQPCFCDTGRGIEGSSAPMAPLAPRQSRIRGAESHMRVWVSRTGDLSQALNGSKPPTQLCDTPPPLPGKPREGHGPNAAGKAGIFPSLGEKSVTQVFQTFPWIS